MSTKLEPAVERRLYFPRTPPLSRERSYSFRKSSPPAFVDCFLILLTPWQSADQPVVLGVASDPEPEHSVRNFNGYRAVV